MGNNILHIPDGYKKTSVGIIPLEWEVKTLGEISTFFSGGTPNTSCKEYYNGSIPFIKSGEISQMITEQFLTTEGLENSSAKIVEKGDILYALYGANSGDCALSRIKGAINQAVLCIRPKANKYYIKSLLELKKGFFCEKYLQGGQGNLSAKIVKNYLFPLPNNEEQIKIAQILGLWDKAIQKQSEIIEKLKLRKKRLQQQLLTGKKHLPGSFKSWNLVKLGEVLSKISNGLTYDVTENDGYSVTRIETISSGEFDFGKVGHIKDIEKYKDYRLQRGDILYSHINSLAHIGKIAYFDSDEEIYHGMNLLLLRASSQINSRFLYYMLSTPYVKYLSKSIAKPAVNQASVSISDLKRLKINLPSLEEQNEIVKVLVKGDEEIELENRKLKSYRKEKRGLMQQLLTGKKRV